MPKIKQQRSKGKALLLIYFFNISLVTFWVSCHGRHCSHYILLLLPEHSLFRIQLVTKDLARHHSTSPSGPVQDHWDIQRNGLGSYCVLNLSSVKTDLGLTLGIWTLVLWISGGLGGVALLVESCHWSRFWGFKAMRHSWCTLSASCWWWRCEFSVFFQSSCLLAAILPLIPLGPLVQLNPPFYKLFHHGHRKSN